MVTTKGKELEKLLDSWTLPALLADLATICDEKSEHIRDNWQDNNLAHSWECAGKAVQKAAREAARQGL